MWNHFGCGSGFKRASLYVDLCVCFSNPIFFVCPSSSRSLLLYSYLRFGVIVPGWSPPPPIHGIHVPCISKGENSSQRFFPRLLASNMMPSGLLLPRSFFSSFFAPPLRAIGGPCGDGTRDPEGVPVHERQGCHRLRQAHLGDHSHEGAARFLGSVGGNGAIDGLFFWNPTPSCARLCWTL